MDKLFELQRAPLPHGVNAECALSGIQGVNEWGHMTPQTLWCTALILIQSRLDNTILITGLGLVSPIIIQRSTRIPSPNE